MAGGPGRRTRPVRRASAGLSPIRAGAALVALAAAAAIYGVSNSSAFDYTKVRIDPALHYTETGAVTSALAPVQGQNVFTLETTPLEAALEQLGTVTDARVRVELPDTLLVALKERVPILIWQVGDRRFLTDDTGTLFREASSDATGEAGDLPVIDDRRADSVRLLVGVELNAADLDAATRLGSLVPTDVDSAATKLVVSVTDENGFVIKTTPASWTAIFGFYTASIRTAAIIPGQVRLLRSLLVGREPTVERIILASETDGTYTPKATPTPSASPSPSPTPRPTKTPKPTATPSVTPSPSP